MPLFTYDARYPSASYTSFAFSAYAESRGPTNWKMTYDPEIPFWNLYGPLDPTYEIPGPPVSYFSYDPTLHSLGYTSAAFKSYLRGAGRTYWASIQDPEIPLRYSYPNISTVYEQDHTGNDQSASYPFLKNLSYDSFAFRPKMLASGIAFWRGMPDPESPFAQLPVAIVDPPSQEVSAGAIVSVTGIGSYSTSNDPFIILVDYHWEWGDGTSSEGVTVQHIYSEIGEYSGTLTVTDSNGNADTTGFSVSVVNTAQYRVLYVIDEAGDLSVTFDDGLNWRTYHMRLYKANTAVGIVGRSVAVDPNNRLMAYFGFQDGRIYKTDDGLRTVGDPIVELIAEAVTAMEVDPYSGYTLYFGTSLGKLYSCGVFGTSEPELIHDFGTEIKSIALAGFGAQRIIVGGENLLSISINGGQDWTSLDSSHTVYQIEFGKLDSTWAYATVGTRVARINTTNSQIDSFIDDPDGAQVNGVSTLFGVDGIIASAVFHPYIRRAYPVTVLVNSTNISDKAPYPAHILADRSNTDKWFWSYDTRLYKTYYSTYPQLIPTYTRSYQVLNSYGKIRQFAQGSLISTYDSTDWGTPVIPPIYIPPIYIPGFPTVPGFPGLPTFPDFPSYPVIGPGGYPTGICYGPYTDVIFVPGAQVYITVNKIGEHPCNAPPDAGTYKAHVPGISGGDDPPDFPPLDPFLPPEIPIGNIPPVDPFDFDDGFLNNPAFAMASKCNQGTLLSGTASIISPTDTIIEVLPIGSFSVDQIISIDDELMKITDISSFPQITVIRAWDSSWAGFHYLTSQLGSLGSIQDSPTVLKKV